MAGVLECVLEGYFFFEFGVCGEGGGSDDGVFGGGCLGERGAAGG